MVRHQLLSIRNACNEQEFPEITAEVALGQLVLFGSEGRDGQSRLALLDEIILNFVKMVNLLFKEDQPAVPVEQFFEKGLRSFPDNFATLIENCQDIELDAHYLYANLCRLSYKPRAIQCQEYKIQTCKTHQQFLQLHADFLEAFPDFKLTQE